MTYVLIVFVAFAFDGGAASTKQSFGSMSECETARAKLQDSFAASRTDTWGRARFMAACVATSVRNPPAG